MRFTTIVVTVVVSLVGTLATAAHGQDRGKPRVRVDVSAGIALPSSSNRYFKESYKAGPELVAGVRYRLFPILDLRVSAEAVLFEQSTINVLYEHTPASINFVSGGPSSWLRRADRVLALFAGPRVTLSSAPTHTYLQGSVGVLAPFGFGHRAPAPALGVGVGIRHSRVFGEFTYTHGFEVYAGEELGYWSLRLGVSLGPR